MHDPFKNIHFPYAQASEASERLESSCIFISQERTTIISNIHFIKQYTLFFEQCRYHLQVAINGKISLATSCLMNYFDMYKFTLF